MRVKSILRFTRYRIQQILLFLFVLVMALMLFYIFGSSQGFLDENLILIMQLVIYISLSYIVLGSLQLILIITEGILHQRFHVMLFSAVIIGGVLLGILYFAMNFILTWV